MLMKLFLKTIDEAYSHAVEVDTMGRTVVMICEREAAEFARDQIHGYGADWRLPRSKGSMSAVLEPVSYTHLDVYKRQAPESGISFRTDANWHERTWTSLRKGQCIAVSRDVLPVLLFPGRLGFHARLAERFAAVGHGEAQACLLYTSRCV